MRTSFVLFLPFGIFLCSSGCVVQQTVYLQDIEVTGPVNQPPVHLTTDPETHPFVLSGRIGTGPGAKLDARVSGHSPVNTSGAYQVDTIRSGNEISFREAAGANGREFTGDNLHWTPTTLFFDVNMQYLASKKLALTLGINYSGEGSKGFWGGNAGLGFISVNEASAIRLDIGLQWRTTSYDATTAVVTKTSSIFGSSENVMFYRDRERSTNLGYYGTLTWNSNHADWPVNLFFNLGLSRQPLVDFQPSQTTLVYPFFTTVTVDDQRAEIILTNFHAAPGIFITLGEDQRLLIGARFTTGGIGEDAISHFQQWTPFVQFDLLF